jgi:two pore calcium channel protein 1
MTIGAFLIFKFQWMGLKNALRPSTVFKCIILIMMLIEAIIVIVRKSSHYRFTRALRPVFILDTQYGQRVRMNLRQVRQDFHF